MAKWKRAVLRFIRIVVAYGLVYGANQLTGKVTGDPLPAWLLPIISALINAILKYLRDKWGLDIKVL